MPNWPAPPTAWPPAWRAGASAGATASACSCPRGSRPSRRSTAILRAGAAYVPVDPTAPVDAGAGILADGGVKARRRRRRRCAGGLREASGRGPGPLPRLIVVGRRPRVLRSGRRRLGRGHGRRRPLAAAPALRRATTSPTSSTPRARPASPRGSCSRTPMPSPSSTGATRRSGPGRRPLLVARAVPLRPVGLRPLRLVPARGDAGPDRRVAGQGPGPAGRVPGRARGSASGTRPRRSWPCWPSTAGSTAPGAARPAARPLRRRGLPDRAPAAAPGALARPRRSGTSTGRPRRTSAPPIAIPDDHPRRPHRPLPDRHGLPAAPRRGWSTSRGTTSPPGPVGELVIAGPGVMRGYFGQPELTAAAFLHDADGTAWYRTGDLVADDGDGCYRLPRPSRPDGQEARLPDRAGRDRVGPLPPRRRRPRGGDRQGRRGGRLDRGLRRDEARRSKGSIIAMKRHCTHLPPPLHGPRLDHLPAGPADDLDRQGRLPGPETAGPAEARTRQTRRALPTPRPGTAQPSLARDGGSAEEAVPPQERK